MKIIVFAGGVGSRLWPLSRKNTPKQFEKIIGDRSTLQQTVERLTPEFPYEDIYIATGIRYKQTVLDQLPQIPDENFIFEPEMRDVGPAIGLVSMLLAKKFPDEPIAILWSDHVVKNIEPFRLALRSAEDLIKKHTASFVFIGQKPRFANQNLGWIELGEKVKKLDGDETALYQFIRLRYRPKLEEAVEFLKNKNFIWNLGYFVTTPRFVCDQFETYAPDMHNGLSEIQNAYGTGTYEDTLKKIYPFLEKISFDDAILEK